MPGPSREEVRALVLEELRSPEMQRPLEAEVQRQSLAPRIEEVLRSGAGGKLVADQVARTLTSPDFRRRLAEGPRAEVGPGVAAGRVAPRAGVVPEEEVRQLPDRRPGTGWPGSLA